MREIIVKSNDEILEIKKKKKNFEDLYIFAAGKLYPPSPFFLTKFSTPTSRQRIFTAFSSDRDSYLREIIVKSNDEILEIKKKKKNFEDLYIFAAGKLYPPSPFFFNRIFDAYISLENFSRRFRVTETII